MIFTYFRKRKIERLRAIRGIARHRYEACRDRGDTRAMNAALQALREATHQLMRAGG